MEGGIERTRRAVVVNFTRGSLKSHVRGTDTSAKEHIAGNGRLPGVNVAHTIQDVIEKLRW